MTKHDLTGVPIIVTENVDEYRKAIDVYVTPTDTVLELGSAQGVTASLLAQKAVEVYGIDKSPVQHQISKTRFAHLPNLHFHNLDAFDVRAILKLGVRPTKIFVDVSGSRPVGDVVELIEVYEKALKPECFVVKCFPLKRLVGCCKLFP
ncbi:uncharacterized protein SPPG_08761 [Spizellomyces punctatus DAOM BR117]|uniref:Methyltransferase domain-containing protein n=1 Tax=Spizellomyces punctatus (strain DAOM BR117) TaxID=645134 RepID=A0A0L0H4H0_SPIPD|nr:uncharacterized protein SPPG_08761 [Spizellomyces punctatus DAOM BR117]KNC95821.1 hypothetical protein SPPG_08761 [Spizellomyces punctatus DAOM BR117]|eukprot:XP_016603861.1 hypothetical protein SPPG_08761 [Spizellomyces punctatus DAOM BR117]